MEESFHVPAVAKTDRYAAFYGVPFLAAFALLEVSLGLPWCALPFLAVAGATIWTSWRAFRLARRGVVLDAEGIGPAEDGERLWTLSWRDYGGFRLSRANLWERFRQPERHGYEILGPDGQPRLHLLIAKPNGRTPYAAAAALEEMRRRLPPGVPDPLAPDARPPKPAFVAGALFVALLGGAAAKVGLADPLSPRVLLGLMGAFVGLGALVAALFETVSIARWAKGWRPASPMLGPLPEEGPGLLRHGARHDRKPLTLEEGGRYRTVDPERTRRLLREMATFCRVFSWILGPALLGIAIALVRSFEPIGLLVLAIFGALFLACLRGLRSYRDLIAAVDDALWVHDGHLFVVRAEGEGLTLPLPRGSDRLALWRRDWWGCTDAWRLPNGDRYAIDRTRLYAAPADLESQKEIEA